MFNKALYAKFSQVDVEQATAKAKKELAEYKKARKLPPETQIFKVLGGS